jgi:hypothetical protein
MDMYVDEQFLDAIQGEILWLIVPFLQKKYINCCGYGEENQSMY